MNMPIKKKKKPVKAVNEAKKQEILFKTAVLNSEIASMLSRRNAGTSPSLDPRRDLYEECGYPKTVTIDNYLDMYEREGVAQRVVSIYPTECFSVQPVIYETEQEEPTPFEEDWTTLCSMESVNPLHYMFRVDLLSGIGEFGVLLLGLPGSPDTPVPGLDKYGQMDEANRVEQKLLYLRAFDQKQVTIIEIERDQNNPRYGKPIYYELMIGSFQTQSDSGAMITENQTIKVHWTRIIHVADNRHNSEIYGVPRMRPVFNKLMDIQKVLGSSAEMFYKGGFPGLSLELDPRILDAMNIEAVDQDSIDEEMYNYQNGLQRYIFLQGLSAKSLAPQVANPQSTLEVQLNSIAMSIGAPLRIFMGSEQAQLASGQDVKTWNRRLTHRQERYLTPMLIRPLIDRLIALGVIRPPMTKDLKTNQYKYSVYWPDVNMPDEDERSVIADRRSAAMLKYMTGQAYQLMQPSDFFRFVLGFNQDETNEILQNSQKTPELKIELSNTQSNGSGASDSGTKGNPPSNPPEHGVT